VALGALAARADPYLGFNFAVEIEGLVVGGFSEVTGLQAEIEVQDHREGGLNDFVHRLPGPARFPINLTLRRGLTDADVLWRWYQDVSRGLVRRHNGSVLLLDAQGREARRWNFVDAYPIRWTGPELRAATGAVAVESIELVHRGLRAA
jgi:phage tail-like protein